MKRMAIYIVVVAALFFAPVEAAEIGKLHPVEVVHVYRENGGVVIETDSGDIGKGESFENAFYDLKETTPGVIYLDTADYLLITKETEDLLPRLRDVLKPRVQLCYAEQRLDLTEVARFLPAHGTLPQLGHWKQGGELPNLTSFEKRLKISKKELDNRGMVW